MTVEQWAARQHRAFGDGLPLLRDAGPAEVAHGSGVDDVDLGHSSQARYGYMCIYIYLFIDRYINMYTVYIYR